MGSIFGLIIDPKKVQAVISNLYIERLELRTEESFDVQPFIHQKSVEEVLVKPTPFLQSLIKRFSVFIERPLKKLQQHGAYYHDNPLSASNFGLLKARDVWRSKKGALPRPLQGMIEGDFGIAMTLLRFLDNLIGCGIRTFYSDLRDFTQEVKQKNSASKSKVQLVKAKAAAFDKSHF